MIRNTLIALSAAAALSAGMASLATTAEAKTSISIGVGLGTPFYPGYGYGYGYGGYPVDYADDCGWHWVKWKKVWNAAHTHKVWKYKKVYSCY